jgi:hypothetical protein
MAATAITCRAGREVVEARVSVPPAKATMRNGDLPAMSVCVGVGHGEDLLCYRRQAALQPEEKDLAMVTVSGTVGHVHHIPMVLTGWGR